MRRVDHRNFRAYSESFFQPTAKSKKNYPGATKTFLSNEFSRVYVLGSQAAKSFSMKEAAWVLYSQLLKTLYYLGSPHFPHGPFRKL